MELPICLMEDESAIFIKKDSIMQIGKIHRMIKGEVSSFTQDQLKQVRYCKGLTTLKVEEVDKLEVV